MAVHACTVTRARGDRGGSWYESGMTRARVLVAEDDADVRELVCTILRRAGHDAAEAHDGAQALRALYEVRPDLVILDVAMPELDGFEALQRIRDLSDVPVLMLTARGTEMDKVRGLRGGADDYVTKPFGRAELLARVDALLRRAPERSAAPEGYVDGLLRVDFAQRTVEAGGRELALTPLEFRLLAAFVRHPGQVLSHDQLLELVWGDAYTTSRDQVKLYVGYLRRKLRDITEVEPIETVRGFGYRYRAG
jgi:DNA-binding response OmpR family regulator